MLSKRQQCKNATHVYYEMRDNGKMSNFVICQQRVKVVEYLAQMARVASNNRFKFSYAHDVLLPEVSPEVPCMCHIPVEPCAVEVLKLGWLVKVVDFNRTGH